MLSSVQFIGARLSAKRQPQRAGILTGSENFYTLLPCNALRLVLWTQPHS
jgi:hypothetical protein